MANAVRFATTIKDEIKIMENTKPCLDVVDLDWFDLDYEHYFYEEYLRIKEMEDKGYKLNPMFDEGMAEWCEKHSDEPYWEEEFIKVVA